MHPVPPKRSTLFFPTLTPLPFLFAGARSQCSFASRRLPPVTSMEWTPVLFRSRRAPLSCGAGQSSSLRVHPDGERFLRVFFSRVTFPFVSGLKLLYRAWIYTAPSSLSPLFGADRPGSLFADPPFFNGIRSPPPLPLSFVMCGSASEPLQFVCPSDLASRDPFLAAEFFSR